MKSPDDTSPGACHRFFGASANNAAWAAGSVEAHAQSHGLAVQAVAAVADPEDRQIVQRVFQHVPVPDARPAPGGQA